MKCAINLYQLNTTHASWHQQYNFIIKGTHRSETLGASGKLDFSLTCVYFTLEDNCVRCVGSLFDGVICIHVRWYIAMQRLVDNVFVKNIG